MAAYVRGYAIASFYQLELWIDEDRKLACLLRQQSEQILYHRSRSKRMKTNHQRPASGVSMRGSFDGNHVFKHHHTPGFLNNYSNKEGVYNLPCLFVGKYRLNETSRYRLNSIDDERTGKERKGIWDNKEYLYNRATL